MKKKLILSIAIPFVMVAALFGLLYYETHRYVKPVVVSDVGAAAFYNPNAENVTAKIGVYVLNVGNLDLTTGSYWMDFYLTILCDKPCHPQLDIMNASGTPEIEDQTGNTRGGTFYSFRVKADMLTDLNLADFPFDRHKLIVLVEDKVSGVEDLAFTAEPTLIGVDENAHVAGWTLFPGWDSYMIDKVYPIYPDTYYSRYAFSITIGHPIFSSFMNSLFAAAVIVLVGLLSFIMRPDAAGERLALTSSTLVAAILYHISLNSAIPPVGYLTYADKFMIANYVIVSLSVGISAALMLLKDKNEDVAQKLHLWTRWSVPILWIVLLAGVTTWHFYNIPIMGWFQALP
jgi:hypothetical protein